LTAPISNPGEDASERWELEKLLASDLRALTAESDGIARSYAAINGMSPNDFRALLVVLLADAAGKQLTAGDLRRRMGLSGAAITYQIERMTDSGQVRREADPKDRRKVILHCTAIGADIARGFIVELGERSRRALEGLSDSDLAATHRTFAALMKGMGTFLADSRDPGEVDGP
jgi:MarR family transcriptional regulator, organic hydroperoxide resistance regulator